MTDSALSLADAASNRAKPNKRCLGCNCRISDGLRCGPCRADRAEELARVRYAAKKEASKSL